MGVYYNDTVLYTHPKFILELYFLCYENKFHCH